MVEEESVARSSRSLRRGYGDTANGICTAPTREMYEPLRCPSDNWGERGNKSAEPRGGMGCITAMTELKRTDQTVSYRALSKVSYNGNGQEIILENRKSSASQLVNHLGTSNRLPPPRRRLGSPHTSSLWLWRGLSVASGEVVGYPSPLYLPPHPNRPPS